MHFLLLITVKVFKKNIAFRARISKPLKGQIGSLLHFEDHVVSAESSIDNKKMNGSGLFQ